MDTPGSGGEPLSRRLRVLLRPHFFRAPADRAAEGHLAARSVYGAIVVFAILLGMKDHHPGPFQSALFVAGAVLGILAAETYAEVLGLEIDLKRTLSREERLESLRRLAMMTVAAEAPVLFLLLAALGLIGEQLAFALARWAALVLLVVYGYLARRASARSRWSALVSGAAVGSVGVLLALLKSFIHG